MTTFWGVFREVRSPVTKVAVKVQASSQTVALDLLEQWMKDGDYVFEGASAVQPEGLVVAAEIQEKVRKPSTVPTRKGGERKGKK